MFAPVRRTPRGSVVGLVMFSAASTEATSFEQPWLEKYRPEHVKDIVGNEETVGRLEVLAQQGNMPNPILAGRPNGKTTSVLALARSLLGDAFKEGVLELNASDDRGIEVVRGRIKAFAQKKVTLPQAAQDHCARRGGRDDRGCAAGDATDDGNLQLYHAIRSCVQPLREDH